MKILSFIVTLLVTFINTSFGQTNLNRNKAESAVKNYMTAKSGNYRPVEFGEFFGQYYSQSLQKLAKTNDTIKYSIVHTYMLKNIKIVDTYFHLNRSYSVVGVNTMDEMTKMVTADLMNNPKFDSILKSIDTETKGK